MNYKYLKVIFLLVSAIIISGCVSIPMSSKSSSNDGIKKLDIQGISDEGLYSKADDDMGLYDINFYKISDSSIRGFHIAMGNLNEKMIDYCGNKERSDFLGNRIKAKYLTLKKDGEVGFFSRDASIVFACQDSQFTKDNQNIQKRLGELSLIGREKYKERLKVLNADMARVRAQGRAFGDAVDRVNAETRQQYLRQMEINQMKPPTNTNCTVRGNQINCNSY
jgi:hypothetical protein